MHIHLSSQTFTMTARLLVPGRTARLHRYGKRNERSDFPFQHVLCTWKDLELLSVSEKPVLCSTIERLYHWIFSLLRPPMLPLSIGVQRKLYCHRRSAAQRHFSLYTYQRS
jgi:hypothetical protein